MSSDAHTHRHAAPSGHDPDRPQASLSLLRLSAADRLLAAAACLVLLWVGVRWALS